MSFLPSMSMLRPVPSKSVPTRYEFERAAALRMILSPGRGVVNRQAWNAEHGEARPEISFGEMMRFWDDGSSQTGRRQQRADPEQELTMHPLSRAATLALAVCLHIACATAAAQPFPS